MTIFRNIIAGAILWALIFLSFAIMEFIPFLKDSIDLQNGIILMLLIPFLAMSMKFYYKNDLRTHGLRFGSITIICSLCLDALITVPFVIIPKGGSYSSFYSDPGLMVMGAVILIASYVYWKYKVSPKRQAVPKAF